MWTNGLMVAWFGNQMPKRFVPSARARQAQRVAGWSMALSGLVYAGFWIAAPKDVAVVGGSLAVLLGIGVTVRTACRCGTGRGCRAPEGTQGRRIRRLLLPVQRGEGAEGG
ncbi:hypothetical protein IB223_07575 [Pseudoxanthomonas sp. PXM03]|uniref:hypothetical protein n=1 Tax=Pseudoxanthomonas sp. PXM03 TaxID=2769284 RepID=UPI0017843DC3|nr:hypothetical protein [Pseudoxanthomonas sp. PXM03]MBD9435946.1 hypothetical protein [Pseudoxanthomonas sp. PXM03]